MTLTAQVKHGNVQELLDRLGNIPPSRIWLDPPPGLATEDDVLEAERTQNRLCELVDGVLVEKGMGYGESVLAGALIEILRRFVKPRKLGVVSAPDGMIRLFAGLIRIPDVSFASWDRFPNRKLPKTPVPALAPELVVEILSESNTPAEMERKRAEYFGAGVQVVWEIDPAPRTVRVFTADGSVKMLDASQTLEGGDVLPGFSLVLAELFAELDEEG
jgi:Uma2 family endonuclease